MGLDSDFLSMLTAPVTLVRRTGKDKWGNETYGVPEPHWAYVDSTSSAYGTGDEGGQQEKKVVSTAQVMMDAVGVEPDDRIVYDSVTHTVTGVETMKDEFGADLYQMVTVENQKKG